MLGKLNSPHIQNVAVGCDCIRVAMVSLTYVAMATSLLGGR